MQDDNSNPIFSIAADFVNQTANHLFLTGKAGTGKTTFLRYIRETSFKKMAVVAPTGVAAINAGGVTIHSLLQLPFGAYLPTRRQVWEQQYGNINNEHSLLHNLRLNRNKISLLRELELLVIDEVSMVRADLLDAMDLVLRHVRRQQIPFGGLQMLYIGDLFQLPPVVKNEEWRLLSEYYQSPFFFDAAVMKQAEPTVIELNKIYRQKDDQFIDLLGRIRNNAATIEDLKLLNQHYNPSFRPAKEDGFITLTTHNASADAINATELERLPAPSHTFKAEVKIDFPEHMYPVDPTLHLKEGAQVMFIKNDKGEDRRYFNGKIATVKSIKKDSIIVANKGEADIELEKETWKNIRYNFNNDTEEVEEEELGTFTQYPIRLAWAITIHKSQGLTFEKAVIDCGQAFAAGQVYVALSRLTSLGGLVIRSHVAPHAIKTDERVVAFMKQTPQLDQLKPMLAEGKERYLQTLLLNAFNFNSLLDVAAEHLASYTSRKIKKKETAVEWATSLHEQAKVIQDVGEKFVGQLHRLINANDKAQVRQRTIAACNHFTRETEDKLVASVQEYITRIDKADKVKKYLKDLSVLRSQFAAKATRLKQLLQSMEAGDTREDINPVAVLAARKAVKTDLPPIDIPQKPAKGATMSLTFEMFKSGKTIEEIAKERNLSVTTIEGHLARFIATGELKLEAVVAPAKVKQVMAVLAKLEGPYTASIVKQQVPASITWGEVKAVIAHAERGRQEHLYTN